MSAITATVQLRRDTAANWTANNPTLLVGEVGIETDTRRMKFGNGTQAWTALPYAQGTAAQNNTGDFDAAGSAASAQAASQPLDSDLTTIAGLTPANDDIIQRKAGAWAARTLAQYLSDLATGILNLAITGYAVGSNTALAATDTILAAFGKIQGQLDAKQPINSACAVPIVPSINSLAAAPAFYAWASQPAALAFFMGAGRWVQPVSLVARRQARVHVVTSGGGTYVAGSKIRLLYRTQSAGYDATIANWTQLGAAAQVEVAFAVGVAIYSSAWIDLATLAKDDVLIAVAGIDGNGTATPNFLNITLEYR